MCTLTSRRTPLMPSGSRTSSWPSMMNSCGRMCRICWSFGIAIAFAVSTTRSMSACVTSFSLIATMPLRVEAADVAAGDAGVDLADPAVGHQLGFLEHALDRRHRRLDVDDDALLQAARRLRAEADDVERAVGRDLGDDRDDLRRADVEADDQILVVLHHRSCTVSLACVARRAFTVGCFARLLAEARHARGESVAIAQVDVIDARARRARARRSCGAYDGDEAREPRPRVVAAELERQRAAAAAASQLPAAARRQPQTAQPRARAARAASPTRDSAPPSAATAVGPVELRQLAVAVARRTPRRAC